MTPLEFAEKYWNLDVYIVPPEAGKDAVPEAGENLAVSPLGTWKRTSVASYRLGKHPNDYGSKLWSDVKKNVDEPGKEAITVLIKSISGNLETKTFLRPQELGFPCTAAFWGKGSPEEVQLTLQLRYRFQTAKLGLDEYTKLSFIGLDCNGFVGNYIQRVQEGAHWLRRSSSDPGPSTSIPELMKCGSPVKTFDDLSRNPGDIYMLARTDAQGQVFNRSGDDVGHIMITNPDSMGRSGQEITVDVVESTGGLGLVKSQYRILKVDTHGVFRVHRGSKQHEMNVRITRLGPH